MPRVQLPATIPKRRAWKAFGDGPIERHDPSRYDHADQLCDGPGDRFVHVGAGNLPAQPHTCAQVGGAEKHGVHTIRLRDRVQVSQPLKRFDLRDQAQLFFSFVLVVPDPPVACGAGHTRHATHAVWAIAHGMNRGDGLVCGLDIRDHHCLRAHLEDPFEQGWIVGGDTHDRARARVLTDGLKRGQHLDRLNGGVIAVYQNPVKPRTAQ